MVVLKQQTQVLVCPALLESSVTHLVCLLLMGYVQLVIIAQVGSPLARRPCMVALLDINALRVLIVPQSVNLEATRMNHYKTLAKDAQHDTTVMLPLVEWRTLTCTYVLRVSFALMAPDSQRNSPVKMELSTT